MIETTHDEGIDMRELDFYSAGWDDCLELLEKMGESDKYATWQEMIDELKTRFNKA